MAARLRFSALFELARKALRLEILKDLALTIQAIVTTTAIIAAAWWFIAGRQLQPRIRLDVFASHRLDLQRRDQALVCLEARVTNTGAVHIKLRNGKILVHDVNPGGTANTPGAPPEA
jgi:hypothetical protein